MDVLGKGLFACVFLKYQLIRIGIIIWIQHGEYAFVFFDCNELSFQANTMVTWAVPSSMCQVTRQARGKKDVFKDCKWAKECKFLLTGAGCISWTEDFLFMAHYNSLFSQVPPQKMYKDYSPSGVHVQIDARFPSPWLFFPSFSSCFPYYALS